MHIDNKTTLHDKMTYRETYLKDKRRFKKIFTFVLTRKIELLSLCFTNKNYTVFSLRLYTYIFRINLLLLLNCLFIGEKLILDKYENNNKISVKHLFLIAILASFLGKKAYNFILKFTDCEKELDMLLFEINDDDQFYCKLNNNFLFKIKCRIKIVLLLILFLSLIFESYLVLYFYIYPTLFIWVIVLLLLCGFIYISYGVLLSLLISYLRKKSIMTFKPTYFAISRHLYENY